MYVRVRVRVLPSFSRRRFPVVVFSVVVFLYRRFSISSFFPSWFSVVCLAVSLAVFYCLSLSLSLSLFALVSSSKFI